MIDYGAIQKMGRRAFLSHGSDTVTPMKITRLRTEAWRQSTTDGDDQLLNDLVASERLSKKGLQRIKSVDRKCDRDIAISGENLLILELNSVVKKVVASGSLPPAPFCLSGWILR